MFNFEKDFFGKYYYILDHGIILEIFRNDKHYFEILRLDLFIKFYDVLGHNIIIKIFKHIYNFVNNGTVASLF